MNPDPEIQAWADEYDLLNHEYVYDCPDCGEEVLEDHECLKEEVKHAA